MFKTVEKSSPDLEVGDLVYYGGDRANQPGKGEIVEVEENYYIIEFEDGREMRIESFNFSKEYDGTGLTKFVPYEEYEKYRQEKIKQLKNS